MDYAELRQVESSGRGVSGTGGGHWPRGGAGRPAHQSQVLTDLRPEPPQAVALPLLPSHTPSFLPASKSPRKDRIPNSTSSPSPARGCLDPTR